MMMFVCKVCIDYANIKINMFRYYPQRKLFGSNKQCILYIKRERANDFPLYIIDVFVDFTYEDIKTKMGQTL